MEDNIMKITIFALLIFGIVIVLFISSTTSADRVLEYNCSNMDLFMTSECLNQELNSFYKYNISNTGKDLSFEKLRLEGGVCKDFAEWLKYKFLELGAKYNNPEDELIKTKDNYKFYVRDFSFSTGNDTAHEILISSNKEGYCIFSNENYECKEFDNGKD